MNWTEERVALLRKLWAEGFSASQIAAQLGGITRNAVIGKAHRLKLAGRTKAQPRRRANTAAEQAAPAAVLLREEPAAAPLRPAAGRSVNSGGRGRSAVYAHGSAALDMNMLEDAALAQQPRPREGVVIPMRRLSLMQLTEHTCKWPVGDPLADGFYFCGAESDESGPYCRTHAKLAFNSAADKKKN